MKKLVARLVLMLLPLAGLAGAAWAGMEEGLAAYDRGDYAAALEEWKPLAEQGDAGAQYYLGVLYQYGQGVPKDYAVAVKWFRHAAERGDAAAQYNLGTYYHDGRGVEKSFAEAATWFRRAAEQGLAEAQFWLGSMYFYGQGVPEDFEAAATWLCRAAEQGHAPAAGRLAAIYAFGLATKPCERSGLGSAKPQQEPGSPPVEDLPAAGADDDEAAPRPTCGPFVRDDADCVME